MRAREVGRESRRPVVKVGRCSEGRKRKEGEAEGGGGGELDEFGVEG